MIWGVVGRRVVFRVSKWSQMDQHRPTWFQEDTKRDPKAGPKATKVSQKAINKKQNKQMCRKGRFGDPQPHSEESAQIAFFKIYFENDRC